MSELTPRIRPLNDRIVVIPQDAEATSKGGIVIPGTAQDKPMKGKVVAVGKGKYHESEGKYQFQPLQVQVGDEILFGKYSGTTFKLNEKEFLVMREEDVMGILE